MLISLIQMVACTLLSFKNNFIEVNPPKQIQANIVKMHEPHMYSNLCYF